MELIRDSLDAWSNFGTFSDTERPDPCHVLRFWEWELQGQHWDAFLSNRSQAAKDTPRLFWQNIVLCSQLEKLYAESERRHNASLSRQVQLIDRAHPRILPSALALEIREKAKTVHGEALRCHAVLLVLQDFHRREYGLWAAPGYPEPTRKQQRRYWQSALAKVAGISPEQWKLLGVTSQQLRRITTRAEQFAQNPPPEGALQFVLAGSKGSKKTMIDLSVPARLSPDPPTRGVHHDPESHGFRLNVEIAVLHTLLEKPRVKPLWPTITSLLQRFNPQEFPPAEKAAGDRAAAEALFQERIEKRVQKASLYPDAIQRSLDSYLDNARTLTRAR